MRLKFERRHLGVANNNAFRKGFRQLFNRVTLMKTAERRRLREGTVIEPADAVAVCASHLRIRTPFLDETGTARAFALTHAPSKNNRRKERREQGWFHENTSARMERRLICWTSREPREPHSVSR